MPVTSYSYEPPYHGKGITDVCVLADSREVVRLKALGVEEFPDQIRTLGYVDGNPITNTYKYAGISDGQGYYSLCN